MWLIVFGDIVRLSEITYAAQRTEPTMKLIRTVPAPFISTRHVMCIYHPPGRKTYNGPGNLIELKQEDINKIPDWFPGARIR